MTRALPGFAAALTASLVVLLPASPALAHNALVSSTPAGDATLSAAPTSVSLVFVEKLNPDFTTVALSDAARTRVPTGAPVVDGASGTVAVSRPLANGAYTVAYRVVSVDGHTVQGSYRFTVADPAQPAAAPAPASAAAAPSPSTPDTSVAVPIALGAGAVLLVLIGAVLYLRGRRRETTER